MVLSTEIKKKKTRTSKETAGVEVWQDRVWYALRHLDDRSLLNQCPLARLAYIQKLANTKFKGNALVKGLALKHALLGCVDRILLELSEEPGLSRACQFLKLIKKGYSVTAISKGLGLSREHVTRVCKKKAVELVTQEFLSISGHSNLLSKYWQQSSIK